MPRRCRMGKARASPVRSIQRRSRTTSLSRAYEQKSQVALQTFVTETSHTAGTSPLTHWATSFIPSFRPEYARDRHNGPPTSRRSEGRDAADGTRRPRAAGERREPRPTAGEHDRCRLAATDGLAHREHRAPRRPPEERDHARGRPGQPGRPREHRLPPDARARHHAPAARHERAQHPRARATRTTRQEDHRPRAARAPGGKHRLECELIGAPRTPGPDPPPAPAEGADHRLNVRRERRHARYFVLQLAGESLDREPLSADPRATRVASDVMMLPRTATGSGSSRAAVSPRRAVSGGKP